ncbi:MAG: phospholipase D-like domain-containing protein [Cyclobacteriaceae bacterium]|nr:phospholipase D-like domain-containing protein [Cyclobacteriaceae bacterium]
MSLRKVYRTFTSNSLVSEGSRILEERFKPLLSHSTGYDRISAFFSPYLIKAIFTELTTCLRTGGRIRLIIGIHDGHKLIPILDEIESNDRHDRFVKAVSKIIEDCIEECLDLLDSNQNITRVFAELINQDLIKVKFATVRKDYNSYETTGQWPTDDSLFHPKIALFRDMKDVVILKGSINETNKGYGGNVEEATFINSWDNAALVKEFEETFLEIWEGRHADTKTIDFNSEFRKLIKKISQQSIKFDLRKMDVEITEFEVQQYIRDSPFLFCHSFENVNLLPHQHAIVREALSRWPIRALIADEVGLGKTIEAGAIISYLLKFTSLKRFAILVPSGLKYQWQTELYNLFNLKFYVYEPQIRKLVFAPNNSPTDEIINVDPADFYDHGIERIIFSWHYLRIRGTNDDFRLNKAHNLDFVLVDEAHGARLREDGNTVEATKLYNFLQQLLPASKHHLLLTATPKQTSFHDYYGLLQLATGHESLDEHTLSKIARLNEGRKLSKHLKQESVLELIDLKKTIKSIPELNCSDDDPVALLSEYSDSLYIQNHPTTLVTLRNTRDSLCSIGYKFPDVSLQSNAVSLQASQERIFLLVFNYIQNLLFTFESEVLGTQGIGFVKSIYAQRMVSSIKACYDTLSNRRIKLNYILDSGIVEEKNLIDAEEIEDGDIQIDKLDGFKKLTERDLQIGRREIRYIDEILDLMDESLFDSDSVFDPKIKDLLSIIQDHLAKNHQILVFSRFTSTTQFIVDKLRTNSKLVFGRYQGKVIELVNGDNSFPTSRITIAEKFRNREFPLMICSDAASEGLNLQSACVLINVDVPWNPSRLLQRFGRIDRFGQRQAKLYFYNLFYPGTIEDRMYSRLHQRNEDFRKVLGTTPEITTLDHLEDLTSQEILDDDGTGADYLNSMIQYSANMRKRIHELILEAFESRADIYILNNKIIYETHEFTFSTNEIDSDYLNLLHPIFSVLNNRIHSEKIELFEITNSNNQILFWCIKFADLLFPIIKLQDIVKLLINKTITINTINGYKKNNLKEMLYNVLTDTNNPVVNHNKVRFSDGEIEMYQNLELLRIGILYCEMIND